MSQPNRDDYKFLARAFVLAKRGSYTVSPNPMVGAVIVLNNVIVGEGWHQRAGEAHAEVIAISAAGKRAKGATAYVTLEPCNHSGRTGPCSIALIEAGVVRVVIAAKDCSPEAAGGAERLRAEGIRVDFVEAWPDINRGFSTRIQQHKPFVSMKLAASIDGRTAMANGESQWITGPEARYQGQRLRAESCAIITGIGSILADNSRLSVRPNDWLEPYPDLPVRQPLCVVLDSTLAMPSDAAILQGACLIVYSTATTQNIERLKHAGAALLKLPALQGRIELPALLSQLASEYQFKQILVEAGATLSGEFIRQGLVDELHVFSGAMLMGSDARAMFKLDIAAMNEAIALNCVQTRAVGNDMWQIYRKSGD